MLKILNFGQIHASNQCHVRGSRSVQNALAIMHIMCLMKHVQASSKFANASNISQVLCRHKQVVAEAAYPILAYYSGPCHHSLSAADTIPARVAVVPSEELSSPANHREVDQEASFASCGV